MGLWTWWILLPWLGYIRWQTWRCNWDLKSVDFELIEGWFSWVGLTYSGAFLKGKEDSSWERRFKVKRAHGGGDMARVSSSCWEWSLVDSQQEKQGLQFYYCKELNSANDLNELGSGSLPTWSSRWICSQLTPWFQLCETLSRVPRQSVPDS